MMTGRCKHKMQVLLRDVRLYGRMLLTGEVCGGIPLYACVQCDRLSWRLVLNPHTRRLVYRRPTFGVPDNDGQMLPYCQSCYEAGGGTV